MEDIETIMLFRKRNGFYQNDHSRYSMIAKSRMKADPIFKCEYFLSQFYINKERPKIAKKYIKKAVKLSATLPCIEYKNLILAINLNFNNDNNQALEILLNIRNSLIKFPLLISEIDKLIASIDEKSLPQKIKYNYNGIMLNFNHENDINNFTNNVIVKESNDYQTDLTNLIIQYEIEIQALINYANKKPMKIKKLVLKCENASAKINLLDIFLKKNFQENVFVVQMNVELRKLCRFYEAILEYQNGNLSSGKDIDEYKVAPCLINMAEAIEKSKTQKIVDVGKAREIVFSCLEKVFRVENSLINMPFLPVFYDTAFDYIQYPKGEEKMLTGIFKKFSIFKKNK